MHEPHPDFAAAAGHLDPLIDPSAIGFGCDGTPHYVQGPYDDADRIVRTLRERVGVDNFHFTVEVPLQRCERAPGRRRSWARLVNEPMRRGGSSR